LDVANLTGETAEWRYDDGGGKKTATITTSAKAVKTT